MTTAPLCDENPAHGIMQAEHIYTLNGEINTRYGLYWFCQIKDCNGYGGPVKGKPKVQTQPMEQTADAEPQQLPLM